MIQPRPCPSCGRVLTLHMGMGAQMCLNCRFRWHLPQAPSPAGAAPERASLAEFSPRAWQRLEVYRRAIAAGFYRDW